MLAFILSIILSIIAAIGVFLRSRSDIALEVLALRQQVSVLKRIRPRPPSNSSDRLFRTALRRFWSRWADVLVIVKPVTVVGWHRTGYRLYLLVLAIRPPGGRPKITDEIRGLIRRLATDNLDWDAPKIHGELLKLGFVVSERTGDSVVCAPSAISPSLHTNQRELDQPSRALVCRNHRQTDSARIVHQRAPTRKGDPGIPGPQ